MRPASLTFRDATSADYEGIHRWYSRLRKEHNWRGWLSRQEFDVYIAVANKEAPNIRHRQLVALNENGDVVGYIRFLHLKASSQRLPADATRIVDAYFDPNYEFDSIMRPLHQEVIREATARKRSLVYTEQVIGLTYDETTDLLERVSGKEKSKKLSLEQLDQAAAQEQNVREFAASCGMDVLGKALPRLDMNGYVIKSTAPKLPELKGQHKPYSEVSSTNKRAPYLCLAHVIDSARAALKPFNRDGFDYVLEAGNRLESFSKPQPLR